MLHLTDIGPQHFILPIDGLIVHHTEIMFSGQLAVWNYTEDHKHQTSDAFHASFYLSQGHAPTGQRRTTVPVNISDTFKQWDYIRAITFPV